MAEVTDRVSHHRRSGPGSPPGAPRSFDAVFRAWGGWRWFLRRRPEVPALMVAALAWPAIVLLHATAGHDGHAAGLGGAADAHHGHVGHGAGASDMHVALIPLTPVEVLAWTVMVTAMMVPLVWPAVRHVGLNSLRWRRQRAITVFLAVYVAVWTGFGAVVLLARDLFPVPPERAFAVALAVAALWQLSPQQRRFRWECHRTVPLPPRGVPAFIGDVRFGLRQGLACLGVCWPLMLAMALVAGATALWMVMLTAAMACAKLLPRSYRLSRPLAAGLGAAAALVLATATV